MTAAPTREWHFIDGSMARVTMPHDIHVTNFKHTNCHKLIIVSNQHAKTDQIPCSFWQRNIQNMVRSPHILLLAQNSNIQPASACVYFTDILNTFTYNLHAINMPVLGCLYYVPAYQYSILFKRDNKQELESKLNTLQVYTSDVNTKPWSCVLSSNDVPRNAAS